jgi:hypothetical protein
MSKSNGGAMMNSLLLKHPRWLEALALFAVLFGLLTLVSGGTVLFDAAARQAAGNYVPFVLWFNFLAGFTYIAAGMGLWFRQRWAAGLSFLIAGATLVVFIIFGGYILSGGSYELRTLGAMSLRTVVWFVVSVVAYRQLNPKSKI